MKRYVNPLPLTSPVLSLIILLALSPASFAQTTKRRTTPARKSPGTTPQRQATSNASASTPTNSAATPNSSAATSLAQPAAPIRVVIVNGQTLSTSDFDPAVRQELETAEQKIAEARRSVLDLQINTMLLEVEAKKRGIDTHRLYQTEVTNRIPTPTPAQIKKFIDDNRSQLQLDGVDQASINQQVTAYLHDEAENKLADDLVKKLRQTNPVVMGVDVNSPNLSDDAVLATIAGQPVKAAPVKERLKPIIYKIHSDAYLLTKQQADQLVDNMLLLDEAKKRQVGPEEIIRTEVSD
jgi:hypothetical protein